jgi:hypothetical protein
MYRCHFTNNGHIVAGYDLIAVTVESAIKESEIGMSGRAQTESVDGFEIWEGSRLLHAQRLL